ncbi:MAG TPA: hypothetical protein VG265_05460 [Gaiellaceae bacterium]|jgi:hypothetical protein|nr:hypothetical protein [Gaiellaceae bacterium]
MGAFAHHPLRTVRHEAHVLREIEEAGERADTPLIAIGLVAAFVLPIGALMMLLAFGIAWLFS